jgi:hypothetical protein
LEVAVIPSEAKTWNPGDCQSLVDSGFRRNGSKKLEHRVLNFSKYHKAFGRDREK